MKNTDMGMSGGHNYRTYFTYLVLAMLLTTVLFVTIKSRLTGTVPELLVVRREKPADPPQLPDYKTSTRLPDKYISTNQPIGTQTTQSPGLVINSDSLALNRSTQRKNHIKKVCQTLGHSEMERNSRTVFSNDSIAGHGNFFASPKLDVVMMSMAKTGTSNLLVLLCMAQGPPCSLAAQNPSFGGHKQGERYMKRLGDKTIWTIHQNYRYMFTTVRNPWKRLVSVWIDKFLETSSYRKLCSVSQRWSQFDRQKTVRHEKWTFLDFLEKCVIYEWEKIGPNKQNPHWRPQSTMGSFCALNYNFIGSTETMSEDLRVLTKEFGFTDIDAALAQAYSHRRPAEIKHETTHLYNKTWTTIDKQTMGKIKLIYAVDFHMFDYPDRP